MNDEPRIPHDLTDLMTTDFIAHVSSIRPDGGIATHLMWIDWDGERVLTSSPVGSVKGANWRANPEASVSVVDRDDDWRYVIVRGRVTDIRPDTNLEFIDRMAQRYMGSAYRRRDEPREVFVIMPEHVELSRGGRARRRR